MAEQGQDSRIRPANRKALAKAKPDSSEAAAAPKSSAQKGSAQSSAAKQNGAAKSTERALKLPAEPAGLTHAIRSLLRATPSWMTSMVLHVVILLVLGVMTLPEFAPEGIGDLISNVSATEVSPFEDLDSQMLEPGDPMGSLDSTSTTEALVSNEFATMSNSVNSPFNDPTPAPPLNGPIGVDNLGKGRDGLLGTVGKGRMSGDGPIGGRGATAKQKKGYGATDESLAAVARALKWLAEHQLPDGSWSFDHRLSPKCAGKCGNPGSLKDSRFGSTGLALMSFLGAGQTHKEGEYKKTVYNALGWLVRNMNPKTGQMYQGGEQMYAHGIATIALCEAVGMTNDKSLMGPARAAIGFIITAQDPVGGGWRYQPRQPGDTSVVGWQLMALKSAKFAYIKIPPQTIAGANNFLNIVQSDSGARIRLRPGRRRPGDHRHRAVVPDAPGLEEGQRCAGPRRAAHRPDGLFADQRVLQLLRLAGDAAVGRPRVGQMEQGHAGSVAPQAVVQRPRDGELVPCRRPGRRSGRPPLQHLHELHDAGSALPFPAALQI